MMVTIKRVRKLVIELIQKYILPRYIFNLLINPPNEGVLKLLDGEIRQEIKGILYLTSSTATGFFYAQNNSGELGLPRFEHLVKLGTLKSAINIENSSDPAASSLINEDTEFKLKKIANSIRINCLATSLDKGHGD
jgi:hypothetical protein